MLRLKEQSGFQPGCSFGRITINVWESKSVASTLGWQDAAKDANFTLGEVWSAPRARCDIGDTQEPRTAASDWRAQEIPKDRAQRAGPLQSSARREEGSNEAQRSQKTLPIPHYKKKKNPAFPATQIKYGKGLPTVALDIVLGGP